MGLKEQQDLLARLYTDPNLQESFLAEPSAIGSKFGLSADEIADLSELAEPEVRWFSDSLFWKRYHEVKKLLPLSARAIGVGFEVQFREFAKRFNPTSVKKHLEDALAFATWPLKTGRVGEAARDVVRFESVRLRHNSKERAISFCRTRYDLRPLLSSAFDGRIAELPPRNGVAVWIRLGKVNRFFYI